MINKAKMINVPLYGEVFKIIDKSEDADYYIFDQAEHDRVNKMFNSKRELNDKYKALQEKYNNLHDTYMKYKVYLDENNADIEAKKSERAEIIQHLKDQEAANEAIKKTKQDIVNLCRERANKERGIKDKKGDIGYVLLSSEYYLYKLSSNYALDMWKTVVQTPFFSNFNYSQMLDMWDADEDRYEFFEKSGIGKAFAISGTNAGKIYEDIKAQVKETPDIYVGVSYKRNFKSGFWEATIIHNTEVTL